MEIEKGKTYKYLKEKRQVSQEVKNSLKSFTKIKKAILNELKEGSKTIPEIAKSLNMPAHETVYYLMSLLKYGFVYVDKIDDMDEYFYYKLKDNG